MVGTLCVLVPACVALLWSQSDRWPERLDVVAGATTVTAVSANGWAGVAVFSNRPWDKDASFTNAPATRRRRHHFVKDLLPQSEHSILGIQYLSGVGVRSWDSDQGTMMPFRLLIVPYRWLLPITLIPAVWYVARGTLRMFRVLGRARRSQCIRCGYTLRGLTSGRCPECGGAVPSPPAAP
jgi:hypothetical protein